MLTTKKNSIKSLQKKITKQLRSALPNLNEQITKKKFEKRIKKIAKLLTKGIKEIPPKKSDISIKKTSPGRKKMLSAK